MKSFVLLIISFMIVFTNPIEAKNVIKTTLKKACKLAPIIVVAKVVKHQYENIDEGASIEVEKFSLWKDYQIIKILKNSNCNESISKNSTVRVPHKSNSCFLCPLKVTRRGKNLEFLYLDPNETNEISTKPLENFLEKHNSEIILFLKEVTSNNILLTLKPKRSISEKNYKFSHVGWFVSPSDYSEEIIKSIQNTLINQAK